MDTADPYTARIVLKPQNVLKNYPKWLWTDFYNPTMIIIAQYNSLLGKKSKIMKFWLAFGVQTSLDVSTSGAPHTLLFRKILWLLGYSIGGGLLRSGSIKAMVQSCSGSWPWKTIQSGSVARFVVVFVCRSVIFFKKNFLFISIHCKPKYRSLIRTSCITILSETI